MSSASTFRALADDPQADSFIDAVVPWVLEAGNPYFDFLLGGPEVACRAVTAWMKRESSEVSIRRVTILLDADRAVGGFVALSGADLARCARADSLAALKSVGRSGRAGLLERARAVADLRHPVDADQWFLSKLGVLREFRRTGRGRELLGEYLETGHREGYRRFRVDVRPEDIHTVRLYESVGFQIVAETGSDQTGMRLNAMVMERPSR